jgi:uncharacterized sodium:solute symporter family permease YidK
LYGLEVVIGFGADFCTQAAFAVIQVIVAAEDAADGLTLILLGTTFDLLNDFLRVFPPLISHRF